MKTKLLALAAGCALATGVAFAQVPANLLPTAQDLLMTTAPTIASGFGTSPSVVASNGTKAFQVNVGTGGTASAGVIGLPTAANGWVCSVTDVTTESANVFVTRQTASSTTSATVTSYTEAGVAHAWASADLLNISCFPF